MTTDDPLNWPTHDLTVRRMLTAYVVRSGRTVTVDELVRWLAATGFRPPGRAGKVVSDRLRADVARGRIVRVGRGRYTTGHIPRTTRRRIMASADAAIREARATTR